MSNTNSFCPTAANMNTLEAIAKPLRALYRKEGYLPEQDFLRIVEDRLAELPTARLREAVRLTLLTAKRPKSDQGFSEEVRRRVKSTLAGAVYKEESAAHCGVCGVFIGHKWPLWTVGKTQGVVRTAYCSRACSNASPKAKAKRAASYVKSCARVAV